MEKKKTIKYMKIVGIPVVIALAIGLLAFVVILLIEREDITNYYSANSSKGDVITYYNFATALQSTQNITITTAELSGKIDLAYEDEAEEIKERKVDDKVKKGDVIATVNISNATGVITSTKKILSPIDGTIVSIYVYNNQDVVKNTKLMDIYNLDEFTVALTVSEYDIKNINVGDSAQVVLNANKATFNGTIKFKSLIANTINGVGYFNITLKFNKIEDYIPPTVSPDTEKDIASGITAKTEIPLATSGMTCQARLTKDIVKGVVCVPMKAIQVDSYNNAFVQVIDTESKRLSRVKVKVGINDGTNVEIVEGLSRGVIIYYPKAGGNKTLLDSIV